MSPAAFTANSEARVSAVEKAWRAYAVLGFGYWLAQAYAAWRVRKDIPRVSEMPIPANRDDLPTVSVIMTARDEEREIGGALLSRLEDDYPSLELIVVEDRSSDRTGEIVDAMASEYERLSAIHVTELHEGWTGKVHAMSRGLEAATGDWVLFSDADVKVEPDLLLRTMAFAMDNGLDHLGVYPEMQLTSPLLDVIVTGSSRMGLASSFAWKVSDPDSKAAMGVGSFNLVRRSALDRTRGLEWIKLEIADDLALGQMLKASGARQQFANSNGFARVTFYPTLMEAFTGSERALFTAIGNFSLARCLGMGAFLAGMELSPLVLMTRRQTRKAGLELLALESCVSVAIGRWLDRPDWQSLVGPLGATVMAFMIARAGVLGKARGGIFWRGTFYPTALLKPGRRFRP